ncbi:phenoloxidase-activating factor 2-like [Drosophila elegans]|uniref:phenoloxidase-activating factor 2-like n=1 Tax=Drosophila elegans TaxID=30023 RepID=UPI001BC86A0F|nr:phenoloxidase-activating factor 2-like [Drosophila elegans]
MGRFWAFGAYLLGCVLLGETCNFNCVSFLECSQLAPGNFKYRANNCPFGKVCCGVLRENVYATSPKSVSLLGFYGSQQTHTKTLAVFSNQEEDPTNTKWIAPITRFDIDNNRPQNPARDGVQDLPHQDLPHQDLPHQDLPDNEQCGMGNGNRRRVSTNQASPGEFPWVVAVFDHGKYLSGGSLISPRVVLTGAHRIKYLVNPEIVVRAAEWDMNSNREEFPLEERAVEKFVYHERFNYQNGANNVALLFLRSSFQLNNQIRTICLPRYQSSFVNQRCIVAGWGKTNISDPNLSAVLKKVELPIVDGSKCEQQLKPTKLGYGFQLPQSLICAGGELNQDACIGDGGSAMFCPVEGQNSNKYVQAGIVAWGMGCGLENVPATYTNVALFLDWIEEKLLEFNYR